MKTLFDIFSEMNEPSSWDGDSDRYYYDAISRMNYLVDFLVKKYRLKTDVSKMVRDVPDRWTERYRLGGVLEDAVRILTKLYNGEPQKYEYYDKNNNSLGFSLIDFMKEVQDRKARGLLRTYLLKWGEAEADNSCSEFLIKNINRIKLVDEFENEIDYLITKYKMVGSGGILTGFAKDINRILMYEQDGDLENCIKKCFHEFDSTKARRTIASNDELNKLYFARLHEIMLKVDDPCADILEYKDGYSPINSYEKVIIKPDKIRTGSDLDIISPDVVMSFCTSDNIRKCWLSSSEKELKKILNNFITGGNLRKDIVELLEELLKESDNLYYDSFIPYYPWMMYHADNFIVIMNLIESVFRTEITRDIKRLFKSTDAGDLKKWEFTVLEDLKSALFCVQEAQRKKVKRRGRSVKIDFDSRLVWKKMTDKERSVFRDLWNAVNFENEECEGKMNLLRVLDLVKKLPWTNDDIISVIEKLIPEKEEEFHVEF